MKKIVLGLALLVLLISTPVFAREFIKNGKQIIVSIADQKLYAIQDGVLVRQSSATTGANFPKKHTPVGSYSTNSSGLYHKFVSPYAKGSPLWYSPSNTYGHLQISKNLYIHDADEWRSCYGIKCRPNYLSWNGGSHGCINVPRVFAQWLVSWTPIGTPVTIISESMNSYLRY